MSGTLQRIDALERRVKNLKHPLRIIVEQADGEILAIYEVARNGTVRMIIQRYKDTTKPEGETKP